MKKGRRDLLVLSEDVINVSVHLPIQPGMEPKDKEALKESLRWEAEPLLGFSPAGAPFDFTRGSGSDNAVGGSEWWITSVESHVYNSWKQSCHEAGFKLRCAMDPWSAIASCLPQGNNLLIHKNRVVLAVLRNSRMQMHKTWRRPPGCPVNGVEWIDSVVNSLEWSHLKDEVRVWDLCGEVELDSIIETMAQQTDLSLKSARIKADGAEPWCHLIAAGIGHLLKGTSALPSARLGKADQNISKTFETALYGSVGLLLIAGLAYWYYSDSQELKMLQNEVGLNSGQKAPSSQSRSPSETEKEYLALKKDEELLQKRLEARSWRRGMPDELFGFLTDNLDWENTYIVRMETFQTREQYQTVIYGESSSHEEVNKLVTGLNGAALGQGTEIRQYGPNFEDGDEEGIGVFRITLLWPPSTVPPGNPVRKGGYSSMKGF